MKVGRSVGAALIAAGLIALGIATVAAQPGGDGRSGDCIPVEFGRGQAATDIVGLARPDAAICYLLSTAPGQSAALEVVEGSNIIFSVVGLADAQTRFQFNAEQASYQVIVAQLMRAARAQRYRLRVTLAGAGGNAQEPAPPGTPEGADDFGAGEIRQIQFGLARRGYDPGPVDGQMGRRTFVAIRAFEADNGLAVTGLPSRALYDLLVGGASQGGERLDTPAAGTGAPAAGQGAQEGQRAVLTILGKRFDLALSYGVDEPAMRELGEAISHLPPDLAAADGRAASDAEILGVVEERNWAAQFLYEDAFNDLLEAEAKKHPADQINQVEDDLVTAFGEGRGGAISPQVQALHDEQLALSLAARGLRQKLGYAGEPPGLGHFTVPDLPAALKAAYRRQGFDAGEAYRAYRRLRAAYRAGALSLLDRAVFYPVTLYQDGGERKLQNRADLIAAGPLVMNRALRRIALDQSFADLFVRDQGAMFGNGALWMTPACAGGNCAGNLALRTINVTGMAALEPVEVAIPAAAGPAPGNTAPAGPAPSSEASAGQASAGQSGGGAAAQARDARRALEFEILAAAGEFCQSVHHASGSLRAGAIKEVPNSGAGVPDLSVEYRGIECAGVEDAPLRPGGFCGLTSQGMKCQVKIFRYRDGKYVEAGSRLE